MKRRKVTDFIMQKLQNSGRITMKNVCESFLEDEHNETSFRLKNEMTN